KQAAQSTRLRTCPQPGGLLRRDYSDSRSSAQQEPNLTLRDRPATHDDDRLASQIEKQGKHIHCTTSLRRQQKLAPGSHLLQAGKVGSQFIHHFRAQRLGHWTHDGIVTLSRFELL